MPRLKHRSPENNSSLAAWKRLAGCILFALSLMPAHVVAAPAKLVIERLAMHQFEDGPVLDASHTFLPGETVSISCRIGGYTRPTKEGEHVKLTWELKALDPAGVLFEPPRTGELDAAILPQDKDWVPKVLATAIIPPFAASGSHKITIQVKEPSSGNEVSGEAVLNVTGRAVEPSETLVARNFNFYKGEQDRQPLRTAVYHAGEMLWARFDITGFKFGEKNRFSVDYGLAILRESGEQVFAQPDAASDSNASFYPQRFVPGALSLSVDPAVPKAAYILQVTIRDKVGDQTFVLKQPFRVE
jgi:hypothetical protein